MYDGFSLPMAIVDIIPVVLYAVAMYKLAGALYNKMKPLEFALLSSGAVLCVASAVSRLIWKFLLAFRVCDFTTLAEAFYPMQSCAFILMCLGLQKMFISEKKQLNLNCSVLPCMIVLAAAAEDMLPVYSSHMPFIIVTTIFTAYFNVLLGLITVRVGRKIGILYLVLEFIGFMSMGYIGSRSGVSTSSVYHWIAEFCNIFAEGFLLITVNTMIRGGLRDKDSLKKKNSA